MTKENVASMRSALEFLKKQNEVITITREVDPIYEIAGIQKALEGGPALLFENIKGYPAVRDTGNVFSRRERLAMLFDVDDPKKIKFKCLDAMRNPIPPKVVDKAPCQEVVITKDIDVMATLPVIKHTERDAGRIIGGGNTLLSGKYFGNGTHISFNRMHFRGKDWGTINTNLGHHLGNAAITEFRGEKIPVTINICTPPAVVLTAGAGFIHSIVPRGSDELGFAGGLQGFPVEICKAKTIDAYAVANAEWVIEGYVDSGDRVWESEAAEKSKKMALEPFFPEWPGYLGRVYKQPKFHATAITHRADRPIFFTPLARSIDADILSAPFKEASVLELAERLYPGLVVDVNVLPGVAGWAANVIVQVRKRTGQEGFQRALLETLLATLTLLRLTVVVDEDVDIYSPEDVLWAMTTRVDPKKDIVTGGGGIGQMLIPAAEAGVLHEMSKEPSFRGGSMGFDATMPVASKWRFERAHYPSDQIDLRKWLSEEEIARVRSMQSDYIRMLADTGR
ncbi:MAG: UbiD family decarboxylase [Desulfobacterales bacterium]|nr:UbiD family decarboxylase [Desulfobacterales bacterium]